jgi:hypothetical protein
MEEFWDDSALIKAYEKAVNSFKVCSIFTEFHSRTVHYK